MANRGGSATINGILFQVLGTLGTAADLALRAEVEGKRIVAALLIIEPSGGGGDLQVAAQQEFIAAQWKTRGGASTWSLREVIKDVLPDLYLAVRESHFGRPARYRFMTNGRTGPWEAARSFFSRLTDPPPLDVLPALDDVHRHPFLPGESLTEKDLFLQIVQAARTRKAIADEPLEVVHRKIWHLLSRFEVPAPIRTADLISGINRFLRGHVDYIEDVDEKRRELCTRVLELASRGQARISPEDLLQQGLSPLSFLRWAELRQALRDRLLQQLQHEEYAPSRDVRPAPSTEQGTPIVMLSGEPGQGKTWQLARAASEAAQEDRLVVWVPSLRDGQRPDGYAADEIWKRGLGHERSIDLADVAKRRAQVNPDAPDPWAIVCVDGVLEPAEAARLLRLDWGQWRMRLVFTTTPAIAQQIATRHADRVRWLRVPDFSTLQLRSYLGKHGRDWKTTPTDIRALIRRPILARIYTGLPESPEWSPRHEYDLMERYWTRLTDPAHPLDAGYMRALADTLLEPNSTYLWNTESILARNVPSEAVLRLQAAGWIRISQDGSFEVWHDRLLGWAVAEALILRVETGRMSVEQLAEYLQSLTGPGPSNIQRRFGYVAMDVLWLMCDPGRLETFRDRVWLLLAGLDTRGRASATEQYYRDLIPTLGTRAVPHVIERVRHAGNPDPGWLSRLAAAALLRIAQSAPEPVREAASTCIASELPGLQELGMRLLVRLPDVGQLDRLWQLRKTLTLPQDESDRGLRARREACDDALQACLSLDPGWARPLLLNPGKDVDALCSIAYLFAGVSGHEANAICRESKRVLFAAIPSAKARCLVNCIFSFRDAEETERLAEWVESKEEIVSAQALMVLALFDPLVAASRIAKAPIQQVSLAAANLRAALFASHPGAACSEVRNLATTQPHYDHIYFRLLLGCGDRLDSATIDLVLDWLDRIMAQELASPHGPNKNLLHHPLTLVADLWGQAVLERLQARSGTMLEDRLASLACQWADNQSDYVDHAFDAARTILLKIGAAGFTRVVNAQLDAKGRTSRLYGCESAAIRPDDYTRRRLEEIASSQEMWEPGKDSFPILQQKAIDALAAIGGSAALVWAILQWGAKSSSYVSELRSGQPPMRDEEIRPALEILSNPEDKRFANAILALGHSGRREYGQRIAEILLSSQSESEAALTSLLALEDLGYSDPGLFERLKTQYKSRHHRYPVLRLLARMGTPEALDTLEQALPASGRYDDLDRQVLHYLCHDPSRKRRLAAAWRNRPGEHSVIGLEYCTFFGPPLDPDDPSDQELLWELTSRQKRGLHVVGSRAEALRSLAKVQPDAAFDLAEIGLRDGLPDLEMMPSVLLEIDQDKAIPVLCKQASTGDKAICRTISLALRAFVPSQQIIVPLSAMMQSSARGTRRAAAWMAGFQGTGFLAAELVRLAYKDHDLTVCFTSLGALRQQQKEQEAANLIGMLLSLDSPKRWAAIEGVLYLADPGVLDLRGDPLGFANAIQQAPFAMRHYISKEVEKRQKKVQEDLKSLSAAWADAG